MPVSSVALCVEGILCKEVPRSAPIPIGIALYHSLKTNFNVLLYSDNDRKSLDYWLSLEALNVHSAVEYNEDSRPWLSDQERKLHQILSLRQRGYNVSLIIEPDPLASEYFIENGFSVLTFTHAQYALPQWRPDFQEKRKPWQAFYDAALRTAELRAIDERLKKALDKDID